MKKGEWHFLLGLLLVITVLIILIFLPFVGVLALAAIAAVALTPVQRWLKPKLGGWPALTAVITILLLLIVIIAPLSLLLTKVITEARDFYISLETNGSTYIDNLGVLANTWFGRFSGGESFALRPQLNQAIAWGLNNLGGIFSGTLDIILKTLLWFVALFYFLRDGDRFKAGLVRLSPLADSYDESIASKMATTVNTVVRGALLIAVIQAILVGTGFAFFGVPQAALWGLVAAFAALVPGVGTALVLIPGILFLALTGSWGSAIGLLIWGAVLVGLVDNLLAPYLYGRGAKIHPLFMLFSVLGGLLFFGPAGFILGPVALGLLAALIDIYQSRVLATN